MVLSVRERAAQYKGGRVGQKVTANDYRMSDDLSNRSVTISVAAVPPPTVHFAFYLNLSPCVGTEPSVAEQALYARFPDADHYLGKRDGSRRTAMVPGTVEFHRPSKAATCVINAYTRFGQGGPSDESWESHSGIGSMQQANTGTRDGLTTDSAKDRRAWLGLALSNVTMQWQSMKPKILAVSNTLSDGEVGVVNHWAANTQVDVVIVWIDPTRALEGCPRAPII